MGHLQRIQHQRPDGEPVHPAVQHGGSRDAQCRLHDKDFRIGTCGGGPDNGPAAVRGRPRQRRSERAGECRRYAFLSHLQSARRGRDVVFSRAADGAIHQLRLPATANAIRPGKRAALGHGKQRERGLSQSRRNEQLQSNDEIRFRPARDEPVFCGISALRVFGIWQSGESGAVSLALRRGYAVRRSGLQHREHVSELLGGLLVGADVSFHSDVTRARHPAIVCDRDVERGDCCDKE